jgi:ABC-type sugar transport system permease subunit
MKTGADGMIALFVAGMSEQLTICLIAVAVNLAGMLIIYAALSQSLTRVVRDNAGRFGAIALILISQLFWIAPALWIVRDRNQGDAAAYALWFGNWLVAGFSIVLFLRTAARISPALRDTARLDGLSGFSTWHHTIFPFVRRDLGIVAFFTIMATLLPFWGFINLPELTNVITIFERVSGPGERIGFMVGVSLIGALPLMGVFFLEGRARSRPKN